VLAYLRERELVTHVYVETSRRVRLETGHDVRAVTYVVDRSHSQYAGALSVDEAVSRVSGAIGQSGPNEDYVVNTVDHLKTLGIRDPHLEGIADQIRIAGR
jgi:cation transport protein ChaC